MSDGRATASRAALLELRQEREVVQEGHRFLDEKRVLLAREILRRLEEYEKTRVDVAGAGLTARQALDKALGWHGLENLQVHPVRALIGDGPGIQETPFLGLSLPTVRLPVNPGEAGEPETGGLGGCAEAYAEVARRAAELSGLAASLLRLIAEYRRTERRVRALENLILPELRRDQRQMEEVLEENELEEAIRVRLFAGARHLI